MSAVAFVIRAAFALLSQSDRRKLLGALQRDHERAFERRRGSRPVL